MPKLLIPVCAFLVLVLASCGTTSDGSNPHREIVADAGIRLATLRFIGDDQDKAQRVQGVVTVVQAVLDEQQTVETLRLFAQDEIDWARYQPEETILIQALVDMVAIDLERLVGGRDVVFSPEATERLTVVLRAISAAAKLVRPGFTAEEAFEGAV